MKKKLLTLAMAAVMVVSSAVSAMAAEISGGWWTAWTPSYEIKDGETVEFDIDVTGGAEVWSNVAAVFTNSAITGTQAPADEAGATYKEYCVVRGDNWGWGNGDNKSADGNDIVYTGGIADLADNATFIDMMEDAHLDVTVSKAGNTITYKYVATGANGTTCTRTVTTDCDTSAGLYVFFVCDGSTVKVEKVEAPAGGEGATTAPAGGEDATTAPTGGTTTTPTPDTGDATMVGLLLAVAVASAVVVLKKRTVTE